LDCIYLRFGYICDIKQTCDGHVKQTNGHWSPYKILFSPPLLHETSSMRDGLKLRLLCCQIWTRTHVGRHITLHKVVGNIIQFKLIDDIVYASIIYTLIVGIL
jgi:hypothetical protein